METELRLPLAVEALIPHRKPMRMVDRLIDIKAKGGMAEAVIAADNVLLDEEGQLDKIALAEMIAQTYAAVKGYRDCLCDEPTKQGFLVGIRRIQFFKTVSVGDRLRIQVDTVGAIAGFAVVEGRVTRHQEVIAEGELKLWIQSENQLEPSSK
jgi:3-hydroxymyristoyl/3-hydroxydecanoyl-(acyl carrier protein) dehydratase